MLINRRKALPILIIAGVFSIFLFIDFSKNRSASRSRGSATNFDSEASFQRLETAFRKHYPFTPNVSRDFGYEGTDLDKAFYEFPIPTAAIYVYKAYYDLRDPEGPRIRVLITANCTLMNSNTTRLDLTMDGKSIGIGWKKMTNGIGCKSESCKFWHYDIASKVYEGRVPDTITFHRNEFAAEIPVERSPAKYTDDVSACIGALHWYNDWPRLILYVEMARLNGISRILVTWQSISKEVKAVIDYYQQRGIIQPHPWPLLPFNEKRDPNANVFIVSHNLFTQHCNFWSRSKYTFLSDVDELLYMRYHNTTLFDLLETWYRKKSDIAGFKFKHTPMALKLAPEPFDYDKFLELDALRNPVPYRYWRFPKSIWLTEATRIAWVHYAKEFFGKRKNHDIPAEEALYFHLRDTFENANTTALYPDVQLFKEDEIDERLVAMANTIREIFPDGTPNYRAKKLAAPRKECQKKPIVKGCRDSGVSCFPTLRKMDEWIFAVPTPESFYIPV
ncbi:unnamed protein product, partial [Mesorhabditis spiculigera]